MPTTTGIATEFITFSRASLATVTDADGKIKWAPHNLLSNSESFDGSSWGTTGGVTVTGNSTSAPNSTTTADTLAFTTTGFHYQGVSIGSAITGLTMTGSMWLWSPSGKATISLRLSASTTGTDQAIQVVTLTSTPTLYTVTRTFTSSDTGVILGLDNRVTQGGDGIAGNVIAWGAHLYRSDLGGMQANTSEYPLYNPTTPKNLLAYTEDFTSSTWTKYRSTITSNAAIAPNGLQVADKLVPNSGQTQGAIFNATALPILSGSVYTASIYAKAAELGFVFVSLNARGSTTAQALCVNLSTGAVSNQGALGTYTVTDVGNGWWRISCTGTSNTTGAYIEAYPLAAPGTDTSYTGNGTSGIFVWGAQLSNSASVDPYSSNGFAAPATGAYHGPRRDFDSSGACRGLLVEEARTNLPKYSNEFGRSEWANATPQVPTVVANTSETTAPDGTNTATKATATGTFSHLRQDISGSFSGVYTVSFFVKAGNSTQSRVALFDLSFNTLASARINWSGGTISSLSLVTGTASYQTLANGWFRVIITAVSLASDTSIFPSFYPDSDAGTGHAYVYGAQVEAGSFATSYIPTAASAVGRSQDIAYLAASAFPYSTTEGVFVVNCTTLDNGPISVGRRPFSFDQDGTFFFQIGATYVYDDSTFRVDELAVTPGKHGVAVKTNDFAVVANAGAARTGTGAFTGNQYNILRLGRDYSGLNYLNGHVRQITYIPRRLTNAELQTRTT